MVPAKLRFCLFLIRISVFIVMCVWTLDKFVNPDHAVMVFQKIYMIEGFSKGLAYLFGALQMIVIIAFLFGYVKTLSYGIVFLMQLAATVAPWKMYMKPWEGENILFYAALPMLAAIFTLFLMRREDTILSRKKKLHQPKM